MKYCMLQGIIREEQVNTFNIPHYYPSPNEVELEVLNEGSFAINHMELFETESDTSNMMKMILKMDMMLQGASELWLNLC
jgi:hypothetical protein